MKKSPALAASSFAVVADLRPASRTIVLMTPVYMPMPGKDDAAHDHRVAVLFDEDEDERVIDVLTAILYRSPHTFSKISAIREQKGHLTVWAQGTIHVDRTIITNAAADTTVLRGDSWSVDVREVFCHQTVDRRTLRARHYSFDDDISATHPDGGTQPQADQHDRLVRAVDSIIPLGGTFGAIDWRGPPLPDPQLERDLIEQLKIAESLDRNNNETTLSLKRGRGRRE